MHVLLQEYDILTSTYEEMQSKSCFLIIDVYTVITHPSVSCEASLSVQLLESMKVGDHFDMYLGY